MRCGLFRNCSRAAWRIDSGLTTEFQKDERLSLRDSRWAEEVVSQLGPWFVQNARVGLNRPSLTRWDKEAVS